jgi:integral membrane sensor domain MASE1
VLAGVTILVTLTNIILDYQNGNMASVRVNSVILIVVIVITFHWVIPKKR